MDKPPKILDVKKPTLKEQLEGISKRSRIMKYLANGLNWLGFLGGRPVASSHRSNEVPYVIKFSAFSNHLVIFMKLLSFLIEALIIEFPN